MSVETLVWLGCGESVSQAALSAKRIILVEARKSAVDKLNQRFGPSNNVQLQQACIAATATNSDFFHYSVPEFSALSQLSGLKQLFPGIRLERIEQVSTTAIDDYIVSLGLEDSKQHKLVIDIIDQGLTLLEVLTSSQLLNKFSQLEIQSSTQPLYQGAVDVSAICSFLAWQGYDLISQDNTDPDLPRLCFKLNVLWQPLQDARHNAQQLTDKNLQLEKAKQQAVEKVSQVQQQIAEQKLQYEQKHAEISKQLTNSVSENETLQQQFSTAKVTAEKTQAELNGRITGMDAELKKARQQLATAEQQLSSVTEQVKKLEQAKTLLQQQLGQAEQAAQLDKMLDEKIQKLAEIQAQDLNKAVGNLKNHVNTGLGNAAKQLEAFMGIQSYLEKGIKPLSFHGWPISPDIGLYIAGLIDANNYDVIIEFGSGTSTVLMAKALIAKHRSRAQKLQHEGEVSARTDIAVIEGDISALPARIVTFEHNSKYHAQTLKALQDNGVDNLVDLVHAPLVDYQHKDGTQYLYYSCADKLAELARVFKDRKANIMVLVDGPPGATNKNARFPAMPHLLNELSQHTFTVIMDDYNRAEEKEIVELWKKIAIDRCLNPEVEVIPSEKGLAVLALQ
ncbi:hypothetical protein [Arsukibacterium sp.]|uniref:hypothetical protein n=1 Tax=Arsukibacterium sp. TaxID=1977258 RepID=UPI001BD4AFBB|nr:hypothetical protein [Arsukibacterium sp.]